MAHAPRFGFQQTLLETELDASFGSVLVWAKFVIGSRAKSKPTIGKMV